MRVLSKLILLLSMLGLTLWLCCPPDLHVEVAAQSPLTERVIFLVDRSGSMDGDHFTRALKAFSEMINRPTDDLEIAIIAFNDTTYRWPGKPEDGVPFGWARLPSSIAAKEAENWLTVLGAGGDTILGGALREALAERRDKLSIVVVSDGLFGRERTEDLTSIIETGQAEREQNNLGKAIIGVYGLGPHQKILTTIAEMGGGGYLREEVFLEDPIMEFGR